MPFASALSTADDPRRAAVEACERAGAELGGRPDLAVLFFSPHHIAAARELADVCSSLSPEVMMGCVAEGVICNGREIEEGPALSLWLAKWPRRVRQHTFHLVLEATAMRARVLELDPDFEPLRAERKERHYKNELAPYLDADWLSEADRIEARKLHDQVRDLAKKGDFGGMNEVYSRYLVDPPPARATVQVARLPRDVRIEVDAIAVIP